MKINKTFLVVLVAFALVGALIVPVRAENNDSDHKKDSEHEKSDNVRILGSTIEIHIEDNGKVLVRGAKVMSISGNSIIANVMIGSTTIPWNVSVSNSTEFQAKKGNKVGLADIVLGDYISFQGKLVMTSSQLTVNAKSIKDWSLTKKDNDTLLNKHLFEGRIVSISGSTTPTTLGIIVGSQNFTVNLPVGVSILNNNWLTTTLGMFKVGDHIRVAGAVQVANLGIIDATVVRDVDLK